MVKKILGIAAGCVTVLLVLFFFLTILFRYKDFFGTAVTFLLCGCIIILMLFVIYIMTSWIVDAVRKSKQDEDNLSEKSLEKLLSGKGAAPMKAEEKRKDHEKRRKKAEEKAENWKLEETASSEVTLVEEVLDFTIEPPLEAVAEGLEQRTAEIPVQEIHQDEVQLEPEVLGEVKAQKEAKEQIATKEKIAAEEQVAAEEQLALEERKAQAVASVRKQAEAAAAARRRAAQTAARTQAFAAIGEDTTVSETQTVAVSGESVSRGSESIWDKMQVRQSAAPQLSSKEYMPTARYAVGPDGNLEQVEQGAGTMPVYPQQVQGQPMAVGVPVQMGVTQAQPLRGRPIQGQPLPPPRTTTTGVPVVGGRPVQGQPLRGRPMRGQPLPPPRQGQTLTGIPIAGRPPVPPRQGQTLTGIPLVGRPVQGQSVRPIAMPMPQPKPVLQATTAGTTGTIARPPVVAGQPLTETGQMPTIAEESPAKQQVEAAVLEPPKRRGRPPKPKDPEEENKPKRPRGRPPKPKDPEEENKPKRPRGRPPKPKDPEEENKPKRPRGRPKKNPEEGETEGKKVP